MALTDFAAEVDWCSQCSGCKWIPYDQVKSWRFAKNCPSHRLLQLQQLLGARPLRRAPLTPARGQRDHAGGPGRRLTAACACGSCDVSCKICRYNLEPLEMVRELKFHLVENGHVRAEHTAVLENVGQERQPDGPAEGRTRRLGGRHRRQAPRAREERGALLRRLQVQLRRGAPGLGSGAPSRSSRGPAWTSASWGHARCAAAAAGTRRASATSSTGWPTRTSRPGRRPGSRRS